MALLETVFTIFKFTSTTASGIKSVVKYFRTKIDLEKVLADLVEKAFKQHQDRINHLCPNDSPIFHTKIFADNLRKKDFDVTSREELEAALLPMLDDVVSTPGFDREPSELTAFYKIIISSALKDMWKELGSIDKDKDKDKVIDEILLSQNDELINKTSQLQSDVEELKNTLSEFSKFSKSTWQQYFERTLETAPPLEHIIEEELYKNPFLLGRAEDFNHNYSLLAKLFYRSPEWQSIQSKTDNVFIEGGRGTGKSMLLRRLTAQATVAATRQENEKATFNDANQEYFGVYVKLTRGYYDQLLSVDTVQPQVSSLLTQQELNIEIFDSFVDTLNWLEKENALTIPRKEFSNLITELNGLFPLAPKISELHELQSKVIQFEQEQIISYYRNKAFDIDCNYTGSAQNTVTFLKRLSRIFRECIFPNQNLRLFLLIDEFETLLLEQQVAINTVIKMRLNDLSIKIAVRKSGRKTSDTFTLNDPIQDPRDYINVSLNYKVNETSYADLLKGIANKRLRGAGYKNTDIQTYLVQIEDEALYGASRHSAAIMTDAARRIAREIINGV